MPHLSPMNWLMMNLFILFIIFMMNSIMWWSNQMKFSLTNKISSSTHSTWNWL